MINVESGYNDGIVAPIFVFALTVADDHEHATTPIEAPESGFLRLRSPSWRAAP